MKKQGAITGIIIAVFLIIVFGYIWYQDNQPTMIDEQQVEHVLPEGVSVVEEGGNTNIINEKDGYSLDIKADEIDTSYADGFLKITYNKNKKESINYESSLDLSLDKSDIDLVDWIENYINSQEFSDEYSYQKINDDGFVYYIINIPSYADSEKILLYKSDNGEILSLYSHFDDPVEIFKNIKFLK